MAAACSRGEDPLAGQLNCQQRMVELPSRPDVAPQKHRGDPAPTLYDALSRRYAAMDLDGCTDDQRGSVRTMVKLTHAIAVAVARSPGSETGDLEKFEQRRIAMQQDLERMRAARLR